MQTIPQDLRDQFSTLGQIGFDNVISKSCESSLVSIVASLMLPMIWEATAHKLRLAHHNLPKFLCSYDSRRKLRCDNVLTTDG